MQFTNDVWNLDSFSVDDVGLCVVIGGLVLDELIQSHVCFHKKVLVVLWIFGTFSFKEGEYGVIYFTSV